MTPAAMKAVLAVSKHEPVQAAIGLTADGEGLLLLDKKAKPRKVLANLRAAAAKEKITLNTASLRFGRAEVDPDYDSAMVRLFVNKEAAGPTRTKLVEVVKRAAYQKVEINVDPSIEEEAEGDEAPGTETQQTAPDGVVPPAPPEPPKEGPDPALAVLMTELTKIVPAIGKIAQSNPEAAAGLKALAGEMGAAIKAGDVAAGTAALDKLKDGLRHALTPSQPSPSQPSVSTPPPAGDTAPRTISVVNMQKSRLAWDGLRKSLQSQLKALEGKIIEAVKAHNEDEAAEDSFNEAQTVAGIGTLHKVLDQFDGSLIDKLDEALNAEGQARQTLHDEAVGIVKRYQDFVASDPMIAVIDDNGFMPTAIRPALEKTLAALAHSL